MGAFGMVSNLVLVVLLAGIGLVVLGRLSGWWLLVLAGAFSLVSALLGISRGLGRMAVPGVADAVLLTGAALAGAWTWRQVLASGRRVSPLDPDGPARTWVLAAGAAAVTSVLLHVVVSPAAAMAGLAAGLVAVGLVALAHRWRVGFLLLGASQVVTAVQLALAVPALVGSLTAGTATALLLPSVIQLAGICLLSLWGWRDWGARERTRGGGAAYA